MTVEAVRFYRLECDSCGVRHTGEEPDRVLARINASHDGWKYAAWEVTGKGYQKRRPKAEGDPGFEYRPDGFVLDTVPKQWDCCPDCSLPESPVEAAEIRGNRKVRGKYGVWQDKEPAS